MHTGIKTKILLYKKAPRFRDLSDDITTRRQSWPKAWMEGYSCAGFGTRFITKTPFIPHTLPGKAFTPLYFILQIFILVQRWKVVVGNTLCKTHFSYKKRSTQNKITHKERSHQLHSSRPTNISLAIHVISGDMVVRRGKKTTVSGQRIIILIFNL